MKFDIGALVTMKVKGYNNPARGTVSLYSTSSNGLIYAHRNEECFIILNLRRSNTDFFNTAEVLAFDGRTGLIYVDDYDIEALS